MITITNFLCSVEVGLSEFHVDLRSVDAIMYNCVLQELRFCGRGIDYTCGRIEDIHGPQKVIDAWKTIKLSGSSLKDSVESVIVGLDQLLSDGTIT